MEELLTKIRNCETMKELDLLRIQIVRASSNSEEFNTLQTAFTKKKNSLKRKGHSRWKEGYTLQDAIKEGKTQNES